MPNAIEEAMDIIAETVSGLSTKETASIIQDIEVQARAIKKSKLEHLFRSQIQTLRDHAVPENLIMRLLSKEAEVIEAALKIDPGPNHIPFLPSFSRKIINNERQISMIDFEGLRGGTILEPKRLRDDRCIPKDVYYMIDIEDGTKTMGLSPEKAMEKIANNHRYCLSDGGIISLLLHSRPACEPYGLATRFEEESYVVIFFNDVAEVVLDFVEYDHEHPGCGTPSYLKII